MFNDQHLHRSVMRRYRLIGSIASAIAMIIVAVYINAHKITDAKIWGW